MERDNIKQFIKEKIQSMLNVSITDNSRNLFSCGISAYEMLYIAEEIENQYKLSCEDLFGNDNYEIMTIDGLALAISRKLYS